MSFTVAIDLISPWLGARTPDRDLEQPMSPSRIVGALLYGAYEDGEPEFVERVRRILAGLPTDRYPTVFFPPVAQLSEVTAYTLNTQKVGYSIFNSKKVGEEWGVLSVGLTSQDSAPHNHIDMRVLEGFVSSANRAKRFSLALALADRIVVHIPADLSLQDVADLSRAASNLPYYGTSITPAVWTVHDGEPTGEEIRGLETWMFKPSETGAFHGWGPNLIAEYYDLRYDWLANRQDGRSYRLNAQHGARLRAFRSTQGGNGWVVFPFTHHVPIRFLSKAAKAIRDIPDAFPAIPTTPKREATIVGIVARQEHREHVVEAFESLSKYENGGIVGGMSKSVDAPGFWATTAPRWVSVTPAVSLPDARLVTELVRAEFGDPTAQVVAHMEPVKPWQQRRPSTGDGLTQWWLEIEFSHAVTGPIRFGEHLDEAFGVFAPFSNKT